MVWEFDLLLVVFGVGFCFVLEFIGWFVAWEVFRLCLFVCLWFFFLIWFVWFLWVFL